MVIRNWLYDKNNIVKLCKEFIDADISQGSTSETTTNPEAIYTSRFMSFSNLSKPMNSIGVKIEDLEGIMLINFDWIYSYAKF